MNNLQAENSYNLTPLTLPILDDVTPSGGGGGGGGGATSFTPIAANQYGSHPGAATLDQALAYLYQQASNAYVQY